MSPMQRPQKYDAAMISRAPAAGVIEVQAPEALLPQLENAEMTALSRQSI